MRSLPFLFPERCPADDDEHVTVDIGAVDVVLVAGFHNLLHFLAVAETVLFRTRVQQYFQEHDLAYC